MPQPKNPQKAHPLFKGQIARYLDSGQLSITDFSQQRLQGASYDLTLSNEIAILHSPNNLTIDLKKTESYCLKHGEVARVRTKEQLSLKNDIYGALTYPSKLAREGIAVNIAGHVDPGFRGVIEFTIFNYSGRPFPLKMGQDIATLCVHQLDAPAFPYSGDYQDSIPEIGRTEPDINPLESCKEASNNSPTDCCIDDIRECFKSKQRHLTCIRYLLIAISISSVSSFLIFNPLKEFDLISKLIFVFIASGTGGIMYIIHSSLRQEVRELSKELNPDNNQNKHELNTLAKMMEKKDHS